MSRPFLLSITRSRAGYLPQINRLQTFGQTRCGPLLSPGASPSSGCRHLLPAGGEKGYAAAFSVPRLSLAGHVPSPRLRGEG
ncbi:hypothetical protein Rleg_0558 [Rhizobium leguminosarum bv. trifolii WSM1325]|uniref:Uncharacterized protein n=1 Tax=Rhizobium leguminosarum bv. trifolii (strain WSM1325) TaxID=395491 RepID=C6B2P2_RHILS|nr:hypothetical protein Rleg_0558 [Rhizobium leguminosarum bv. trifolii WSM1325]